MLVKIYGQIQNLNFFVGVATNPVYELYDKKGLVYLEQYPISDTKLLDGEMGYHLREGCHYLSRYDWNLFIEYIKKHR